MMLELTKEEIKLVYETFEEQTHDSLTAWMQMIDEGQYDTDECNHQWSRACMSHDVMLKAAKMLGIDITAAPDRKVIPFKKLD